MAVQDIYEARANDNQHHGSINVYSHLNNRSGFTTRYNTTYGDANMLSLPTVTGALDTSPDLGNAHGNLSGVYDTRYDDVTYYTTGMAPE